MTNSSTPSLPFASHRNNSDGLWIWVASKKNGSFQCSNWNYLIALSKFRSGWRHRVCISRKRVAEVCYKRSLRIIEIRRVHSSPWCILYIRRHTQHRASSKMPPTSATGGVRDLFSKLNRRTCSSFSNLILFAKNRSALNWHAVNQMRCRRQCLRVAMQWPSSELLEAKSIIIFQPSFFYLSHPA